MSLERWIPKVFLVKASEWKMEDIKEHTGKSAIGVLPDGYLLRGPRRKQVRLWISIDGEPIRSMSYKDLKKVISWLRNEIPFVAKDILKGRHIK